MAKILKLLLLMASAAVALGADTNALVDSWLAAQSQLKTWSADFTQTRTLKTLKQPLTSKGRLLFKTPNNFRWELGNPAQTMAIRNSNEMVVVYPKLKRAEKYPLSGAGNEPWRDALALMDAGFPSNRGELDSRFKLLSSFQAGAVVHILMEPRSAIAKRFMSEVKLELNTNDFSMAANQLKFADGSVLRNDFTNTVKNPDVAANAFVADVPKDFKIVEPMKQ